MPITGCANCSATCPDHNVMDVLYVLYITLAAEARDADDDQSGT